MWQMHSIKECYCSVFYNNRYVFILNKLKPNITFSALDSRITFGVQPCSNGREETDGQWSSTWWHRRQNQAHLDFKEPRRGRVLLKITLAINYNRSSSLFHNMKEVFQVRSPRVVPLSLTRSYSKTVCIGGGPAVVERRLFTREV